MTAAAIMHRWRTGPWRPGSLLLLCLVLSVLTLLVMLACLASGSVDTDLSSTLRALTRPADDMAGRIVVEVRLPRVLAAFMVGAMLALAGALMQVLLRNPLAEPYVLGVSGGASAFALLAMSAGLGGMWVHLGALAGALFTILLVFALTRGGGEWNPMRVLLTGVVVAAGWGALISFLLVVSPSARVHGMLFWLMGDLGSATFQSLSAVILFAGVIGAMMLARSLNLMARGDLPAAALGVSVVRVRYGIYFLASLLTAGAVMQAGSIGFIGLIIPHVVRLLLGSDHRVVLPVSVFLGGTLLVVADTLARTLFAPQQLPVGILTALIGVPVFLVLLHSAALRQRP